jgi:glycosyltransferase involved in cell wall biosynthesis
MSKRIKILFIISDLTQGGAERQFVELIEGIDKDLFQVEVMVYSFTQQFYKAYDRNRRINTVYIHRVNSNRMFRLIRIFYSVKRILLHGKYDLVQTTLFHNGLLVRALAGPAYRGRIISTMRTSYNLYTHYQRKIEKSLLRYSYVVVNNKYTASKFKEDLPQKMHQHVCMIYNGFDTKKFYPNNKPYERSKSVKIGNIGRVVFLKNQMQIIRALEKVPHANLVIIGDSGDKSEEIAKYIMNQKLEGRISILPATDNILHYYHNFDFIVISSHLEGCPNVAFESMLSKCLCIISVHANTDQYVKNKVNGLVYDGSDEDLVRSIDYAIGILGDDMHETMLKNAYNYAQSEFATSVMVNNYEKLYIDIHSKCTYSKAL